jgi:hypothetical protein
MPGLGAFGLGTEWGESGIGFLGVRLASGDHSILPRRFEITGICSSSAIQRNATTEGTQEHRGKPGRLVFFFGINRFLTGASGFPVRCR